MIKYVGMRLGVCQSSSANTERLFSGLNRIITASRNRLTMKTVFELMVIRTAKLSKKEAKKPISINPRLAQSSSQSVPTQSTSSQNVEEDEEDIAGRYTCCALISERSRRDAGCSGKEQHAVLTHTYTACVTDEDTKVRFLVSASFQAFCSKKTHRILLNKYKRNIMSSCDSDNLIIDVEEPVSPPTTNAEPTSTTDEPLATNNVAIYDQENSSAPPIPRRARRIFSPGTQTAIRTPLRRRDWPRGSNGGPSRLSSQYNISSARFSPQFIDGVPVRDVSGITSEVSYEVLRKTARRLTYRGRFIYEEFEVI